LTPAARLAAAAEVLDRIAAGRAPAEAVLKSWGAANRYAGGKDRRAIAERVYACLRHQGRLAWAGGGEGGRTLVLFSLVLLDGLGLPEIEALHTGQGYAPAPLSDEERARVSAPPGEPPAWVAAGLPAFAVDDLRRQFGESWAVEAEALLRSRAPIDLRVNGARATREEVAAELRAEGLDPQPTPFSAWGLRLPPEPPPDIGKLAAFREGRLEIQDEGSQIAAWLAGARPGELVVDYCAGGGGKTLALAQALALPPRWGKGWDGGARGAAAFPAGASEPAEEEEHGRSASDAPIPDPSPIEGEGRLIACDVEAKRLEAIRPRLVRAGVEAELRQLGPQGEGMNDLVARADLVFVDAPCSGSGTWRRRPEAAWRLAPEEVERFHALQVAVLGRAARLVRPGGRLVYVTCSVLTRENGDSASAFAAAHPDFRPKPLADALATPDLTNAGRERLAELAASGHTLQLTPARTSTDGFFVAVFERPA